jgi:hypothetical protein
MASRSTPAAGASGGRDPYPAAPLNCPSFIYLYQFEMIALDQTRYALCWALYPLLLIGMDWREGHFLSTYSRLKALLTPPLPERGRPIKPPTYDQLRTAVQWLIDVELIVRGRDNEAQGQLRLWLHPRVKKQRKRVDNFSRP